GVDGVRDGCSDHRHFEHALAGSFLSLSNGVGDTARFSKANSYAAFVVTHDDEDGPACGLSSLVGLEHFVCLNDADIELGSFGIPALALAAQSAHHSHVKTPALLLSRHPLGLRRNRDICCRLGRKRPWRHLSLSLALRASRRLPSR